MEAIELECKVKAALGAPLADLIEKGVYLLVEATVSI
jgi:hypothetical protein